MSQREKEGERGGDRRLKYIYTSRVDTLEKLFVLALIIAVILALALLLAVILILIILLNQDKVL